MEKHKKEIKCYKRPSKCDHTDRMALESESALSLHCLKAAGDQNDDGIILAEGRNLN